MSETRGEDADIPPYPGQDRPADPGAEAMTGDTEARDVALPSEMRGHVDNARADDVAQRGDETAK